MNIPDGIEHLLASHSGNISRAVLEGVATEAYRSGAITPLHVQQLLGFQSRWETESFLHRARAYYDYTVEDLERDIATLRDVPRQ